MRKFNYIWILSLLILYPLFLTSCDSDDISQNGESSAYAKDFSKGPVSLEMEVDQTEINTSGQLTIILRAKAGDEWKPSFPEPGDLGEFKVLSVKDTIPRLEEDGSIGIIRTIELKPFLSGDYEIPSLTLDYTKGENSGVLLTTPVQIKVTTLLPENTENLEIKELKEPDTFNYNRLIFYSALSFIILLIGFLIFLFFRKRKRDIVIPGIAPSEDAYNKLASLISMNLPEEGKYKEFYYRLNLIVRVYIEKQFSMRAPEQTTEEFLQDLSISKEIGDDFKNVLENFLIHSDLVKFALLKPEEDQIESSIDSCRNFIKVTGEML